MGSFLAGLWQQLPKPQFDPENFPDMDRIKQQFKEAVLSCTPFKFVVNKGDFKIVFTSPEIEDYSLLETSLSDSEYLEILFLAMLESVSTPVCNYSKQDGKEKFVEIVGKSPLLHVVAMEWGEFHTLFDFLIREAKKPDFFQRT